MFDELYPIVRAAMSERRFLHSLGVMHTAVQLAERYGADLEDAALAGLLHDYCKERSAKRLRAMLRGAAWDHCPLRDDDRKIWHAWAGEVAFCGELGFGDRPDAARAIRWHPTGHPDMNKLQKIVFLADYIEPTRRHRVALVETRREARRDLDGAVLLALRQKTAYLAEEKNGVEPHPWSIAARERMEEVVAGAEAKAVISR